jgi:hypothetical protein
MVVYSIDEGKLEWPMNRTFQISLRWIFGLILVAALLAWLARLSPSFAVFIAACLFGSVWPRQPSLCLGGGILGGVVAGLSLAAVDYGLSAGTRLYGFLPLILFWSGLVGGIIGCLVCSVKLLIIYALGRKGRGKAQHSAIDD